MSDSDNSQRYEIRESLDRIYRILRGDTLPDDSPNNLPGPHRPVNEILSRIAELMQDSLPGETLDLIKNPLTTEGDIIYGGADGSPTRLPGGASGQVLSYNTGTSAPQWLTSAATYVNPMTAEGDLIYGGVSGTQTRLAKGSNDKVLTLKSGLPSWETATGSTGSSSGFTNPMTAAGDIIYGGVSGTATRLAKGAANQILAMNSGTTAPEWVAATSGGNSILTAAYASRPAASNDGNLFLPSDSLYLDRDTGSAWGSWGPIQKFTVPDPTGFAWANQSSGTLDTSKGYWKFFYKNVSAYNMACYERDIPTPPYSMEIAITTMHQANYNSFGIHLRDSSTGKGHYFHRLWYNQICEYLWYMTDYAGAGEASLFGATPFFIADSNASIIRLKITDDNTSWIYSYSYDGLRYKTILTHNRNTNFTADKIGISMATRNGGDLVGNVLSLSYS